MNRTTKTLYVRMLGNLPNRSDYPKLTLDEMEDQAIHYVSMNLPRPTPKSARPQIGLDGYVILNHYSFSVAGEYEDNKNILRFLMRYRVDDPV